MAARLKLAGVMSGASLSAHANFLWPVLSWPHMAGFGWPPRKSIKRTLLFACKRAGVKQFAHHSLRHAFISIAHEQGTGLQTIGALVGHAPGSAMTESVYLEIKKQRLAEAAKKIKIGKVSEKFPK